MKAKITILFILISICGFSQDYYFMFPDSSVTFTAVLDGKTVIEIEPDKPKKGIKYKELEKIKEKADTVWLYGRVWSIPSKFTNQSYLTLNPSNSGYMVEKSNTMIWDNKLGVVLTNDKGVVLTKQEFEVWFSEYLNNCNNSRKEPTMKEFVNSFYYKKMKKEK